MKPFKFGEDSIKGQFCKPYTFADGTVYHDEWVNNRREGRGTQTWPDGKVYIGTWKKDQRTGYGRFYHHNTQEYEPISPPDTLVYTGEWANDMKNGYATEVNGDG